jgi:ABC-type sugar transport system permease subunit
MVLSSLKGSTFVAILLSGGAALQAVQILCVYVLRDGAALDAGFGKRLAAIVVLIILTGVFCIIYWLLKVIRPAKQV